ncbi:hypothetical protein RQP46_005272 [Phenoliferia psychrophenolica]
MHCVLHHPSGCEILDLAALSLHTPTPDFSLEDVDAISLEEDTENNHSVKMDLDEDEPSLASSSIDAGVEVTNGEVSVGGADAGIDEQGPYGYGPYFATATDARIYSNYTLSLWRDPFNS